MNKTVEALNLAYVADPNAIHALICNRVPCNEKLAHDPHVVVDVPPVLPDGNYQVGALGLVNAVLAANGLPLVAVRFSDQPNQDGSHRIEGFCKYQACEEPGADE